ncbi:MAG: protein translocase subunit SecF [Desulfarculus sp.]|jgi:preprotein translocase subunit SecF|nr:MAG: protein translocase subunit SecF [Desulfarculus sp.]
MELIKPDINLGFIGQRFKAFILSGLLILMAIVSLIAHGGPNYGVDFAGGILVQVRFKAATDPAAIKEALKPLGMGNSLVQRFGEKKNHEYLIRDEQKRKNLQGLAERVRANLAAKYGADGFEVRRVEMVGPKVGKDLREKALLAIFYAILMIVVYISGRFEQKWGLAALTAAVLVAATLIVQALISTAGGEEGSATVWLIITALVVTVGMCWLMKLRYALGAIVALIHDVAITVGVFSLLDREFTLATVAALLTIIGYSLNDTIIVFDRIRENLKKSGKTPLSEVINASINQTLSRTVLTSGTTMLVLVCLYILGGGVIQDFALALLVGVGVGTYSSIYVASPILLALPEGSPLVGFKRRGTHRAARSVAVRRAATEPMVEAVPERTERETSPIKASSAKKRKKKPGKKKKRR